MSSVVETSRPFEPGTTGWTAADLDDPQVEAQWVQGGYEIVEGVLTRMPPAYFLGGRATNKLVRIIEAYLDRQNVEGDFAAEAEIRIDEPRVLRADAAFLTPADTARQLQAVKAAGRKDPDRTRILVPPTLVIESVSPGHEAHDERIKKRWYAEFGVPNYWILNAFNRSLQCLRLAGGDYQLDAEGRDDQELRPATFPGLLIPLGRLWKPRKPGEPIS